MKDCMVVVIAVDMKDYIADMDYIVFFERKFPGDFQKSRSSVIV